ncbi:MAG: hypothetical protein AMXMBFR47_22740 [Planctomycetota bacterium]
MSSSMRTLLDAAETISQEQLAKSITDALARALVCERAFLKAIERHRHRGKLAEALANTPTHNRQS